MSSGRIPTPSAAGADSRRTSDWKSPAGAGGEPPRVVDGERHRAGLRGPRVAELRRLVLHRAAEPGRGTSVERRHQARAIGGRGREPTRADQTRQGPLGMLGDDLRQRGVVAADGEHLGVRPQPGLAQVRELGDADGQLVQPTGARGQRGRCVFDDDEGQPGQQAPPGIAARATGIGRPGRSEQPGEVGTGELGERERVGVDVGGAVGRVRAADRGGVEAGHVPRCVEPYVEPAAGGVSRGGVAGSTDRDADRHGHRGGEREWAERRGRRGACCEATPVPAQEGEPGNSRRIRHGDQLPPAAWAAIAMPRLGPG